MRRVHGAFIAFALAGLAGPAGAAEITRVASSGEAKNPFDLDLSVRYVRVQEGATIEREGADDELRFVRTRHQVVPRVAVGLYHDLEIHVAMPYVLADDRSWRFGDVGGVPSGGTAFRPSSIETNPYDPDGLTSTSTGSRCDPGPCPLFAVGSERTTVYHGGMVGDLEAGIAWAIFNDRRDDTKPSWVVGTDVTFPTAKRYDPVADHLAPKDDPAPFGEKIWKLDVYTALSKRLGLLDPYFKAHFTKMFESSSTYSNCDHVAEPAVAAQMNSAASLSCASWGDDAGAQLPWIVGATVGTEIVPYEDRMGDQKVAIDLRLFADYTSPQRFYNELTNMTGKLHQTGRHLTMGGLLGLYLRASEYLSLQATASLATRSAHYLTGESLGRDGSTPEVNPATGITADPAEMNPNFDWRYDAPGRRFRITEVSVFELGFAGVLRF